MHGRWIIVGTLCACATVALAQPQGEAIGFHQAQLQAHQNDPVNPDLIDGPVRVPRGALSGPCRTVFGYLPYWESASNIQW
ncbi:MAG TPA: hypothetical protein P5572_07710, partial [Phycisphaerae bacterium]|nr:hypothetical protein [Phycisphaerae bacterium]